MIRRFLPSSVVALVLFAVAGCAQPGPPAAWTASWGAALMAPNARTALAGDDTRQVTLRQTVRASLAGTALRVRISNRDGREPLVIAAASIGRAALPGTADLQGASLALRFGGAPGLTLAPGADAYSDPAPFAVDAGQHLSVSLFAAALPAIQSAHIAAHATQFVAPGNQVDRPALHGARALTSWYHLAGIEVVPPAPAGVLVAIGDSITDGSGAGRDRDERWPDFLARRLQAAGQPMGVINAGIGGNRMLRDDIGPRLVARFARDALDRPGVTHVLMLVGVNDLGRLHRGGNDRPEARRAMLAALQDGWRQLAQEAHARGVCLLAGTITPYGASRLYQPAPHNEADRVALNRWLRSEPLFDGVADFDAAVRDPARPERLLAAHDSGDGLHLSPAGYRAMAEAVPLASLAGCRRAATANRSDK